MSGMGGQITWRQNYSDYLLSSLNKMLTSERHSDTTITIKEKKFHCHRLVLAATSAYFDAMFSSGMKESLSGEVNMEGIEPSTFQDILNFMYQGMDPVSDANAETLLQACAMLQIEFLQHRCEDFLASRMTRDNCYSQWRLATEHNCPRLKRRVWQLILKEFAWLCQTDDFLSFTAAELVTLLAEEDLNIPEEEVVSEAVLKWVAFDADTRRKHLPELLKHIRLPLTQPTYLVDIYHKHPYLMDYPDCVRLIDDAKNFQLRPSRHHDYSSTLMSPRAASNMEDILVLISGGESPQPPYKRSKDVLAYSFNTRRWFHLESLPNDPGIEFATCVHGNDIYLTGGAAHLDCFLRFSSQKNLWLDTMAHFKFGRRRHAMVASGNKLFILGGYNSADPEGHKVRNSIEEYDLEHNEWNQVGELPTPVSSVSAAALGDMIYVFGGEKNDKSDIGEIQCFNIRTRVISCMGVLPAPCKLTRAVVCDDFAYMVMFDGRIIRFSEERRCERVGEIQQFGRVHFGLVHRRGILYVFGGQVVDSNPQRHLCDGMIRYDVRNNVSITMSDRLPTPRLLDSCAKITINTRFLMEEYATD